VPPSEIYERDEAANQHARAGGVQPSASGQQQLTEGGRAVEPETLADKETLAAGAAKPEAAKPEAENLASYYKGGGGRQSKTGFIASFRNPRRAMIGAVAGGGILAVIISIILALVPLKIETIVQNLEHRYFAAGDNAVQKEADSILSSYYRHVVFNNFGAKCRSTIDIACRAKPINTKDLLSAAFRGLAGQDANGNPRAEPFEHKLAREKGILIKADNPGNRGIRYYLSTPNLPGNGLDITDIKIPGTTIESVIAKSDNTPFQRVSKKQLRAQILSAYDDETKFKKIIYRFKVGRLLENKYQVRRFLPDNPINQLKNNFKAFLAERTLRPFDDQLGIVVTCLFSDSPACDPIKATAEGRTVDASGCKSNCETNGWARSDAEHQMNKELATRAAAFVSDFSPKDLEALQKLYAEINQKGLKNYLIGRAADRLLGFFGLGDKKIPGISSVGSVTGPIGVLNSISHFVSAINSAGPRLQKFNYVLNATAMVSLFNMYRSYADQIHQGKVSAGTIGSLTDALGVNNNPQDRVGGTAGAEQSPLYDQVLGSGYQAPPNNTLGSLLGSSALAASSTPTYSCDQNKPLLPGKFICPEESLLQKSGVEKFLQNDLQGNGGWQVLAKAASLWNASVGKIISPFTSVIDWLFNNTIGRLIGPALDVLKQIGLDLPGLIAKAGEFVVGSLLPPSPISSNMSGGRTVNMLIGGADQAGNDYAHSALGGVQLTSTQQAAILNDQQDYQTQTHNNQSFLARFFDKSYDHSPVNQLALALPNSPHDAITSLTTNPLGKIFGSFGSLFSSRSQAANAIVGDSFGIDQYGYPADDPIWQTDPQDYWLSHCVPDPNNPATDLTQQWNQAAADKAAGQTGDANATLMPLNSPDLATDPNYINKYHLDQLDSKGTNPCLLIQASVAGVAGLRTDAVFSPDDLAASGGSGGSSTTTPATGPSGYSSPFSAGISNLGSGRIDQGVDYSGAGPVHPIGDGKINYFLYPDSGWLSGSFISYTLDNGPAAGKSVYIAENCIPTKTWNFGEAVHPGDTLCNMVDAKPHIEMGWALGTNDLAKAAADYGHVPDGTPTAYGVNFSNLLKSLGAPGGDITKSATTTVVGSLESGWPQW